VRRARVPPKRVREALLQWARGVNGEAAGGNAEAAGGEINPMLLRAQALLAAAGKQRGRAAAVAPAPGGDWGPRGRDGRAAAAAGAAAGAKKAQTAKERSLAGAQSAVAARRRPQ
jgi:hypothetical protein